MEKRRIVSPRNVLVLLVLPLMLEDAAAQPEWERLWLALEFTLT